MCLINPKRITTEEDIKCYKVLHKDAYDKLISLFALPGSYQVGRTRRLTKDLPLIRRWNNRQGELEYYIKEHSLYSFKELADASKLAKHTIWNHCVIVECLIPHDSSFIYEGDTCLYNEFVCSSYASQKLKVTRIMFNCERDNGIMKIIPTE